MACTKEYSDDRFKATISYYDNDLQYAHEEKDRDSGSYFVRGKDVQPQLKRCVMPCPSGDQFFVIVSVGKAPGQIIGAGFKTLEPAERMYADLCAWLWHQLE